MTAQPTDNPIGPGRSDAQYLHADGATDTARAMALPSPDLASPGRALSLVGHHNPDTQAGRADEGTIHPDGSAVGASSPAAARPASTPVDEPRRRDQDVPAGANRRPLPRRASPRLADPSLMLAADVVDDLERVRISNENRLRQLTRAAVDSDGEERGFGLSLDHPDVARLAGIVEAMAKLEHDATLGLQRHMRAHPLGAWVKATKGIGEKQGARLIAAVGDPYWNTLRDRPRTVSELWAYSGLHTLPVDRTSTDTQGADIDRDRTSSDPGHLACDPHQIPARVAARRRKGQRANWSNTAKMRAFLCAQSCIKQTESPYRATYDARRAHTAVTHPDWTAGHSHNDALRIVSKAILRDLWRAARDIHNPEGATP